MKNQIVLVALLLATVPTVAQAQKREHIERGKAATALVDLEERKETGTAFCVDPSGVFVTNYHVVKDLASDAEVTLVLNAATDEQESVRGKVIASDKDTDLAILRATSEKPFPFLELGENQNVFETLQCVAFGFPFGKGLSVEEEDYPAISISVGRITSIRKRDSKIQLFQLDAEINPGNSGGPVMDGSGKVVGIVSFGVFATGINFAIPVGDLRTLMARPNVEVTLPEDLSEDPGKAHVVAVHVTPLLSEFSDLSVEASVRINDGASRSIPMKSNGKYRFEGEFVPKPEAENQPKMLEADIRYSGGEIQASVVDTEYTVDDQATRLSETRTLSLKDGKHTLVRRSGESISGKANGLESVVIDFGDAKTTIDLSTASEVSLEPISAVLDPEYVVIVRDAEKEIERLELRGEKVGANALDVSKFAEAKRVTKVPGTISDVCAAGGGKYLLVQMQSVKKLAVFDVGLAKIVKIVGLPSDDCLVVGLLDYFLVFDRAHDVVERWTLERFRKEKTVKTPFDGVLKAVAGGYAANEPLLVLTTLGTDALSRGGYSTFDPMTLTPQTLVSAGGGGRTHVSYRDAMHIRAAGTGRTFGLWCTSHSPQGIHVFNVSGANLEARYEHTSLGHVVPNADGTFMMTGIGGVYTNEIKSQTKRGRSVHVPIVPSAHPKLFLSVPAEPGAQRNLGTDPFKGAKPGVYIVGSNSPLMSVPPLELGKDTENRSWSASDFTLDKRVHYLPDANAITTIPFSNDQIISKQFDLESELKESGVDYFFVSSTPPRTFTRGTTYRYAIQVQSKQGGAKFSCTSGPDGMTVTKSGLVQWNVPDDFSEKSVNVIITITNREGVDTYESFRLDVKN